MRDVEAVADVVVLTLKAAIAPLQEQVALLRDQVTALQIEATLGRERAAALEARALVPGPAGQNGRDGKDGRDGLSPALSLPLIADSSTETH